MPALADEGLDARRFALLARRLRRADASIEAAVEAAALAVSEAPWGDPAGDRAGHGPIALAAERFAALPAEVALRLLGRAITWVGDEGPVELGKLETLQEAFGAVFHRGRAGRLRRTLAGALVTLAGGRLTVERAPLRSSKGRRGRKTLTTG
jgi:tRNA(Ile)-lysidine synthase